MRLGFVLPHIGPAASPANLAEAARRAEALGYESLWVTDRLLWPVAPQSPYPATPDGSLPEAYRYVLDPIATLTFVAAQTSRVALGTSVLDMPYYSPAILARQLAALDILSGGRLRIGLGLGWSKDEFDAVGASTKERGRRADEFLRVLKAVWAADPVEFRGRYYTVPRSIVAAKPVQRPHPPIYLAAYVPAALERAARHATGWMPAGVPVEAMAGMFSDLRRMAEAAGRDPTALELVVRANLHVTERPAGEGRWIFTGSADEIRTDVDAVRRIGAVELIFDPTFSPDGETIEGFLGSMERMRALA